MVKKYYDKMERKGGMISEVHNDFANMPQEVKHKAYPKANYGIDCDYRDNLEGLDAYAKENHNVIMKQKRSASDRG